MLLIFSFTARLFLWLPSFIYSHKLFVLYNYGMFWYCHDALHRELANIPRKLILTALMSSVRVSLRRVHRHCASEIQFSWTEVVVNECRLVGRLIVLRCLLRIILLAKNGQVSLRVESSFGQDPQRRSDKVPQLLSARRRRVDWFLQSDEQLQIVVQFLSHGAQYLAQGVVTQVRCTSSLLLVLLVYECVDRATFCVDSSPRLRRLVKPTVNALDLRLELLQGGIKSCAAVLLCCLACVYIMMDSYVTGGDGARAIYWLLLLACCCNLLLHLCSEHGYMWFTLNFVILKLVTMCGDEIEENLILLIYLVCRLLLEQKTKKWTIRSIRD